MPLQHKVFGRLIPLTFKKKQPSFRDKNSSQYRSRGAAPPPPGVSPPLDPADCVYRYFTSSSIGFRSPCSRAGCAPSAGYPSGSSATGVVPAISGKAANSFSGSNMPT